MNKILANDFLSARPIDEFVRSLQPFFSISRAVGVLPLHWDTEKRKFKVCPLLLWTSSTVLGIFLLAAWYFFITYSITLIQHGHQWSSKVFCDTVVILIFILLNDVSYTVTIWLINRNSRNLLGIFDSFTKVDDLLLNNANIDHDRVYWRSWAQVCFAFIPWAMTVSTAIFAYANQPTAIFNVPLYVLRLVVSFYEQQIVAWCLLAAERFLMINRSLAALASTTRQSCGLFVNLEGDDDKPEALTRHCRNVEMSTIHRLRSAHALMSQTLDRINSTYQASLLANLACLFFTLVTFSYFFTAWGFRHTKENTAETKQVLLSISAVLESVARTILLAWVGGIVAYQGQSTGRFVHRVHWYILKPDVSSEMQQFSLQVLHEKPAISVCGLFFLDLSLIFTMCGAVCTYLIILIQL